MIVAVEGETVTWSTTGGGACTAVVAVAELSAVSKSGVTEATVAVLVIVEPAAPFAVTTSVIVAEAPLGSDANVMVRLLPEPPQTPPAVDEHETKLTDPGRLSVTTTDCASAGPLFVTTIV